MLSGDMIADAMYSLIAMLFLGSGFLYTLVVFIVHLIQKKEKSFIYYLISSLVSGIVTCLLVSYVFYIYIEAI